ncbi:MAG: LD-carboxypeptidase [Alphaproteobacteria bacterium]
MQPLVPPALRPGDTIGIVAPARWAPQEWVEASKSHFESKGLKVKLHPQIELRHDRLAGDDQARAKAINDMFADDSVRAIVCARGGTGSFRILEHIDYELIRRKPKIFCGFSDITTLLHAIQQRTGLITFHGPMVKNFARAASDPRTGSDMLELLGGHYPADGKDFPAQAMTEGTAEGRLTGGNISMLRNMIGTPYDWSVKDSIIFIEDMDEPIYKLDHMLWQFRQAGKFVGVRGVIVGEMVGLTGGKDGLPDPDGDIPYGKSLHDLLREYLPPGIPVCTDFPCGHGDYLTTLPLGAAARIDVAASKTRLSLLQPVVGG